MPLSLRIRNAKAVICKVVLNLAICETGTPIFIVARNSLKPETIISLNNIIRAGTVVHPPIVPFAVNINITEATNSLSAIGSKKVPKFVCSFLILAKYPSKKSLIPAIQNNTKAIQPLSEPFISIIIRITGIEPTLNKVNKFETL